MDVVGHLPPRRLRHRVGGRLAGRVVVPNPASPAQPHGVVPAGGRRPLEEGEAAARAEEPAGMGVVPLLHTAGPGLPPQRLDRLLAPHGGKELAPRVRAAAAAGIWLGGMGEEDLGVPPLQGLAHSGPLGPELGAARENNGGDPERLVLGPVTAVPPPVPGPRQDTTPGSSPTEGARAQAVWAQPHRWGRLENTRAAWRYHQRTRERTCCRHRCSVRGAGGGRGHVPAPLPSALSPSATSWSTRHVQNNRLQVDRGPRPAAGARGLGWGGRVARVPRPPCSLGRLRASPAGPPGPYCPSWGGGGPRPPSRPRPALGGAAVTRRMRPLLYRLPPIVVWGPAPLPGLAPAPRGAQCHRLGPGRPRGLWADPPAGPGLRTLGPL